MKAKRMALMLTALLAVSMTACSGGNEESETKESMQNVETETQEEENEGSEIKESMQNVETVTREEEAEEETEEPEVKESEPVDWEKAASAASEIELGQTYTVEGVVSFSLNECYWADDILPENTDGNYSYVEGEEGSVYLILRGDIQNLSADDIEVSSTLGTVHDNVATLFYFDGSATYEGRWYVGADSVSYHLDAGAEDTLYVTVEVPETLKDSCEKVQMLTGFLSMTDEVWADTFSEPYIDFSTLTNTYLLEVPLGTRQTHE